jgi:hypothetical protein
VEQWGVIYLVFDDSWANPRVESCRKDPRNGIEIKPLRAAIAALPADPDLRGIWFALAPPRKGKYLLRLVRILRLIRL